MGDPEFYPSCANAYLGLFFPQIATPKEEITEIKEQAALEFKFLESIQKMLANILTDERKRTFISKRPLSLISYFSFLIFKYYRALSDV